MLAATAFLVGLLIYALWDYPFGIFFVLVLSLFPGLVFLYLSCVRAGLVALKASGPPNLKKLGTGIIRMFRFNIMINNMIMITFGLGGSVLFLNLVNPDLWKLLRQDFSIETVTDLTHALSLLGELPLAVILILFFALSVSVGIIGTASGAVGATAADQGPNHDAIWGVTRQFKQLFALSIFVLLLPAFVLSMTFGGPLAPISSLSGQPMALYFGLAGYLIWAGCAVCAGKALAYVQTKQDLAAEWEQERSDMLGEAVPQSNLRELRLRRQEAQKLKTPDASHEVEDLATEAVSDDISKVAEEDNIAKTTSKGPTREPR